MGLPTFFRWIFERYPKCVTDAVKPDPSENLNRANPNDEVDNLYIDVNDILHIAFHPEDAQTPSNFVECMESLTAQIEEMVRITRPRQMIYIAFDGVAPRAKLNIQRKRRFEKFQSSTLSKKRLKQLQIYREESGLEYNDPKEHDWNSNCLSPGTDFMFKASNYVSNWIQEKQLKDSFWTGLHIILSDSCTPGEGEHKIMQHIRRMRRQPGYNPNTRHVVAGRDADLIPLALTTHEPNFRILRQVFYYGKMLKCPMCSRHGHCRDCVYPPAELPKRPEHEFIFFDINIFRHCFAQDIMQIQPEISVENVVNDFVFITFFLGNDFLPKIPGLSIRSGAIELLIETYKTHLLVNKDYLTKENGEPCAIALRKFLLLVSNREADLITQEFRINRRCIKALKKKGAVYKKHKEGRLEPLEGADEGSENGTSVKSGESAPNEESSSRASNSESTAEASTSEDATAKETDKEDFGDIPDMSPEDVRRFLVRLDELFPLASFENTSVPWFNGLTLEQQRRYLDLTMYVVPPHMRDSQLKIPYGMHWKRMYYNVRFGIKLPKSVAKTKSYIQNGEIRKVLNEYMRGLLWCWKYYTSENPDWEWFYPHHYGPCMSDLTRVVFQGLHFPENSKPLDPLVYLMCLLPTSDSQFVPPSFRSLIDSDDSPIKEFYPTKCAVDYSEAYVFWQGVVQLPFIDFRRLEAVTTPLIAALPDQYRHLNAFRNARVYVASVLDLGGSLLKFYGEEENSQTFENFDLCSENPREEMTDCAISLLDEDEFSTSSKAIFPIKGFAPKSSSEHSFKNVVAYIKPLEKETFSIELLPGCVINTPEILDNSAGIVMIHNYRRFGTLRKIWYKALHDQRSRMVKETKVLGYFSQDSEDQFIFGKKDPGKSRMKGADPHFDRQPAGTSYQNPFNSSSGGRSGARHHNQTDRSSNPNGSPVEQMMKIMVQQKLSAMMSQPNPNMNDLIAMMQSYVSLQMQGRSNGRASNVPQHAGMPSMQTMMQQLQLLNIMQNAMVNQQHQQQMGGSHVMGVPQSTGPMQGMHASSPMMKNLGGFSQMNMPNSMMNGGMNSSTPLSSMMPNQSFGHQMGIGSAAPAPMMQQSAGMSATGSGGMGGGAGLMSSPSPGMTQIQQQMMQNQFSTSPPVKGEFNHQGYIQPVPHMSEGEILEPGATTSRAESAFHSGTFNQRYHNSSTNSGLTQVAGMGSTSPPAMNNFLSSNYQSVMKQVHTPDGSTPQFSPQNPGFTFPTMNSFQNSASFNQTQAPRSPSGPFGMSSPTQLTPGPGTATSGAGWATTAPANAFAPLQPQFVPQQTGSPNRNFNRQQHQFIRNNCMPYFGY